MSENTQNIIITDNPIIITQKEYKEIKVKNFSVVKENPNDSTPIAVNINLGLVARDENGNCEWLQGHNVNWSIDNLVEEFNNDPIISGYLKEMTSLIINLAKQKGII
jgi:hypothetical protein